MNMSTPTVRTLRKFSPKTQAAYIRTVINFSRVLGRVAGLADMEDLRRYKLHMIIRKRPAITPSRNA
ncbi:MAG: hypothetical protein FJ189_11880 [Gammaproteobacteria bacterium]|nr:hypothetical protein [Gammaproteobacteria bacterium]